MSGTNSTFDPYTQPITIFLADGVTPISISIADIDFIYSYTMKLCINYGAQLGACLVMFFVLAVLTTEKNRRKPLFALNLLSLFLGFLRTLLLALYNVSPWTELYTFYSMDFSAVPRSAYATSVAATVIPLLMTITINMSLTVQTYTVCKIMEKKYAYPVIAMSFVVVLLAIGFRFAQVVTNSIAILTLNLYSPQWIRAGTLITGTMAIWWFSIVFTGKLIWTLYNRKRQGWKQWGAVRVLAIMGGCTMIIPSIFAVLQYVASENFPEAGTLALTLVALLLPLSSLWARMATDEEAASLKLSHLSGSGSKSVDRGLESNRKLGSQSSTVPSSSRVEYMTERKASVAPICPTTIDSVIEHAPPHSSRDSTEVDLEKMGVRVDRSYSVNGGQGH